MLKNTKNYTTFLAVLSALLALALIVLVLRSDPYQNWMIPLLFYTVLLLFILCFTTLAGFTIRRFFGSREYANQYLKISLRQGLWFGILITLLLLLKAIGLFNIASVLLLLLSMIFLESYFIYGTQ
jgi:hypothetical protein